MSDITNLSRLLFFKAESYEYNVKHVFDASECPRPHFCMGLVLEGNGTFTNCAHGERILVKPGDIIFVPITTRYISEWEGSPRVSYISMHFIFDSPGIFVKQRNFLLQKVTVDDFSRIKSAFEYVLEHYDREENAGLEVLSRFYEVLGMLLPQLKTGKKEEMDERIAQAIRYLESNYRDSLSVKKLAEVSHMSESRFFPNFKKATGITPVEYLNAYRINRAIILLINDSGLTIESISREVGFESTAYFRRVFKKVTGKNPREYCKTSMEI